MNDTLSIIIKYGLSIRQIPTKITNSMEMRHYTPGDEVVETELASYRYDDIVKHILDPENYRIVPEERRIFRRYAKKTIIPSNAGFWMCKQVINTSTSVSWDKRTDNLAETLDKSVALFISKIKDKVDEI